MAAQVHVALYKLAFDCGLQPINGQTIVCAVSLVEDFSGISGPTAMINLCFDSTRSTLQKERLTVHGFGNRISCAFVNAALPYKSVCKYCV